VNSDTHLVLSLFLATLKHTPADASFVPTYHEPPFCTTPYAIDRSLQPLISLSNRALARPTDTFPWYLSYTQRLLCKRGSL